MLQDLLTIPAVCRSREFRAFLSQAAISSADPSAAQAVPNDFVSRIYSSVADGMEDFLGNIPVLDQLSVAGQNLISAATTQLASTGGNGSSSTTLLPPPTLPGTTIPGVHHHPDLFSPTTAAPTLSSNADAEAEAELLAFENKDLEEPFVKPIADLFLEAFHLNRENNWLRGRAVVVVLHQLLGGTIERKVRDSFASLASESNIANYIDTLRSSMWPAGRMKEKTEARSDREKEASRVQAAGVLERLLPEVAGSVVGRANAGLAAKRLEGIVNNGRLNTHLAFTLLDELVGILFPDVFGNNGSGGVGLGAAVPPSMSASLSAGGGTAAAATL